MDRVALQTGREQTVEVNAGQVRLEASLAVPTTAEGIIVFAHGSGSSRHSSRNRHVAERLREVGLGTLLMDLLTSEEEAAGEYNRALRFDIPLLADRVAGTVDWLAASSETDHLRVGLFGASTGAAAALLAAARRAERVAAVVSRGGRPDLAGDELPQVTAPTLLIVGSRDTDVLELNKAALRQLTGVEQKSLQLVAGAGHLFEEPGALDEVAELAAEWFTQHLPRHATPPNG